MRYVTLKPQYMLRGWRDLPYALLDYTALAGDYGKTLPLTLGQKEAIELLTAPGVAMDDPLLPAHMRRAAAKLMELGFLEERQREQGLTNEQKYRYADTMMAHALTWSITGNCNLRCRHCYISGDQGAYGEPTMKQCEDIVQQMRAANIQMAALTGGEPMVRRDFWDFVDMLTDNHICIEEIFSNGLLITDHFLRELANRNLNVQFLLSFDGVGWHDWMRGLKGAEEKLIAAIRRLKANGYPVIVTTVLHEKSLASLPATYRLMKELQVDFWRIANVANVGNWQKNENSEVSYESLLNAYSDLLRLMKQDGLPLRKVKIAGLLEISEGNYHITALSGCGSAEQEHMPLCEASKLFPHLLPDGRLLPCMPMCGTEMEEIAPNILTGEYDICRALTDSPLGAYMNYTYHDVFEREAECNACEHKYRCTRCPAASLPHGSVFAKAPLTCQVVKGHYDEKIKEIMGR